MPIKSSKLNFSHGDKNYKSEKNKFCRIILSRDFFNKELKLPEILAMVDVYNGNNCAYDSADLLNRIEIKIIDKIKKIYNSVNEKKSLQTENLSEHILELLLKSLNSEVKYILEEDAFNKFSIKNLNIFVGVIEPFLAQGEERYYFHFSYLNKINNLLIYKQGDKYKLLDVMANNENASGEKDKIFSNIISGKLDNDGYLIIANQNLIDYVIPDKLKQLLISMNFDLIPKHLKEMLSEIDINGSMEFAAIFIYLIGGAGEKSLPENSIERLIMTEKNTEKFLTPSIIPDFKNGYARIKTFFGQTLSFFGNKILKFKNAIKNYRKTEKTAEANHHPLTSSHKPPHQNFDIDNETSALKSQGGQDMAVKIHHGKKQNHSFSSSFYKKSKILFLKILTAFAKFIKNILKLIQNFFIYLLSGIINAMRKIKKMPLTAKLLFILFLILLISFWKGTSRLSNSKVKKQTEVAYNEALVELEQKFSSLEADVIYNNYEDASKILDEIDGIMQTKITEEIPEYKMKYDELSGKVKDYEKKVNKAVEIKNPEKTDMGENRIENIILANNKLIAFSYADNKIDIKDIAKNSLDIWDLKESNAGFSNFKYPANLKDENDIVLYSGNENKLYKFNINEKKSAALNNLLADGDIKNIYSYAGNIYVLDGKDSQIYAYKNASKTKWINDSTADLSDAIDMEIDGNIYILKNNGQILKFYKGVIKDFKLQKIKPALLNPLKIHADSNSKFLYILDPPNKRIIVFNKECGDSACALESQYTSENFDNLKDFTIDEKNKIIYALNGSEVYKVNF